MARPTDEYLLTLLDLIGRKAAHDQIALAMQIDNTKREGLFKLVQLMHGWMWNDHCKDVNLADSYEFSKCYNITLARRWWDYTVCNREGEHEAHADHVRMC